MASGQGSLEAAAVAALRDMRRDRRRRYVERIDVMELLYRVYVALFFGAIGLALLGGVIHEAPATPAAADWLRDHGPALIGLAVAAAVLLGLRMGSHGGPLAIEAAEVQYVLLAPVDRGRALRPAALRQMRLAAIAGAACGAVTGNFVFRRLPGSPVEWIACLALFGALVPVCVLGAALVASGRRFPQLLAGAIGVLLVAWSLADVARGAASSPGTMLGELATLPLQGGTAVVLAGLGLALAAGLVALALLGVGGILLEAARRRAALAAELRFSASVQDLRTVILLRRQLASERSRRRPWLRLAARGENRHPVWRRGWQGFFRWPPVRITRVALIGVAAGALAAGAWSAAPVALLLPGALLFIAALDLVEPLAQESDHPTRRDLLPTASGALISRHLAAPTAATAGVLLLATIAAALAGGGLTALEAGLVLSLPLALILVCAAAISVTNDPYEYLFVSPGTGYAIAAAPPVAAAVLTGASLLFARAAAVHAGAAAGALGGAFLDLAIGAAAISLLRMRFDKRERLGL